MSVDFSNIKEITIPEGKVKEIKSNNVTIWIQSKGLTGTISANVRTSGNFRFLTVATLDSTGTSMQRRTGYYYYRALNKVSSLSSADGKVMLKANDGTTFDVLTPTGALASGTNYWYTVHTITSSLTTDLEGNGVIRLKANFEGSSDYYPFANNETPYLDFTVENGVITNTSSSSQIYSPTNRSGITMHCEPISIEVIR